MKDTPETCDMRIKIGFLIVITLLLVSMKTRVFLNERQKTPETYNEREDNVAKLFLKEIRKAQRSKANKDTETSRQTLPNVETLCKALDKMQLIIDDGHSRKGTSSSDKQSQNDSMANGRQLKTTKNQIDIRRNYDTASAWIMCKELHIKYTKERKAQLDLLEILRQLQGIDKDEFYDGIASKQDSNLPSCSDKNIRFDDNTKMVIKDMLERELSPIENQIPTQNRISSECSSSNVKSKSGKEKNLSTPKAKVERNLSTQEAEIERNLSTPEGEVERNLSTPEAEEERNLSTPDSEVEISLSTPGATNKENVDQKSAHDFSFDSSNKTIFDMHHYDSDKKKNNANGSDIQLNSQTYFGVNTRRLSKVDSRWPKGHKYYSKPGIDIHQQKIFHRTRFYCYEQAQIISRQKRSTSYYREPSKIILGKNNKSRQILMKAVYAQPYPRTHINRLSYHLKIGSGKSEKSPVNEFKLISSNTLN